MVEEFQQLIKQGNSGLDSARLIVQYLDDAGLDLFENGWLDDDPLWEKLSKKERSALYDRMEKILKPESAQV